MPIEHMDMKHPKIIVAGIGPGNESDMTPAVISALQESDVVVVLFSICNPLSPPLNSMHRYRHEA